MSSFPVLSLLIFVPWIGAALIALGGRAMSAGAARVVALLFSASTLLFGFAALARFEPSLGLQMQEQHAWIPALHVTYHLGIDGISLPLVLLTGLVGLGAQLAGTTKRDGEYSSRAWLLWLQGAALGVFLALDFFPWFVFWELSLVPAFFLIRLWGGPNAARAAYQFVIYTLGGSALMLAGFAAIYATVGSLDFVQLAARGHDGSLAAALGSTGIKVVFAGVLLGFAVKVPLFPFHTWLPAAYAEAPTGTAMFLTGVMSKMGLYGFLRILWPLFPAQLHGAAMPLLVLALAGVVFGALAALRQTDLKRMIAYSSLNHLSYCLLAIFAVAAAGAQDVASLSAALSGTLLQMFNHGVSAAALFFCVGVLEQRSGGLRGIGDFGGVRTSMPVFAGLCGFALFSSLGLPGLNGFVGEFLMFRGVFGLAPWAAAAGCVGLLVTAIFLLTFWQRVFHGPSRAEVVAFADVGTRERVVLGIAALLMLVLGLAPQLLTQLFNPLVVHWARALSS